MRPRKAGRAAADGQQTTRTGPMAPKATIWKLERHTLAKHTILRAYLNAWLPIMGMHYNERLVLVDAFCGPGIYEGGEPGSPIIMLNAFLEHRLRNRITAELVYLFIDEKPDRTEELERQINGRG
jgi:three-Cys-motif partner protein